MKDLNRKIENCKKCKLYKNTRHAVPGEGDKNADLMLVGEAPGKYEDASGRPFVGRAGKTLDKLLKHAKIKRQDIFITSVIKHRPPNNRNPYVDEIEACLLWLKKQIDIINPKIIGLMGNVSLNALLSKKGINKHKCKVIKKDNIKYIPLYHPAAAVYNNDLIDEMKEDFLFLKKELNKL